MEFSGQYLTYDEYRLLGGTLNIMPFNLLEFNARKILDERTQGRLIGIEEIPQEVKLCVYSMINELISYGDNTSTDSINKNVASENIDGYSVSYISSAQFSEVIKSKQSDLEDVMTSYLSTTIVNKVPVLYLGVI